MGARQYIRDFSVSRNSKRNALGWRFINGGCFLLAIGVIATCAGCQKKQPQPPAPAIPRVTAAKLTILVVNDSGIASGIKLLRGEWAERSGGELQVEEASIEDLLAGEQIAADLVIYPSRYLGEFVDRDWLRPVRKSLLESDDVACDQMYPLIRNVVLPYGATVYSLTLGEPPLLLAAESPPEQFSWMEISNPVLSERAQLKFPYALALLVRGVAYAGHRRGEAAWFDPSTMQPRITEPPYAKALQEMVGSASPSTWSQIGERFGWPHAKSSQTEAWLALPPTVEVYSAIQGDWTANDDRHRITFLGFGGRSVGVTRGTRNSASAFKLLRWLVSDSIAQQLSPRSAATMWFRRDQASQARKWLPSGESTAELVRLVDGLLSSDDYFLLPRIPQIDQYLQVLDEAVRKAAADLDPSEGVLEHAADQWDALTDRVGRDRQRAAYRKHLNLEQ